MIEFPRFNIPDLTRKAIPPEVYDKWVHQNVQDLAKTGLREKLRQDPTRVPVNKQFVLH